MFSIIGEVFKLAEMISELASVIDASCHLADRFGQEDPRYYSESLCAALPEQNSGALLHELGPIHESESYRSLVLRAQILCVDVHHLCCLANNSTVDHCLVVRSY